MGTGFAGGVLSQVSADLGLNDLAVDAITWKEVFIVIGPWFIPGTSWVNDRPNGSRHIIKFAFIGGSSGSLLVPGWRIRGRTSVIHHIIFSIPWR